MADTQEKSGLSIIVVNTQTSDTWNVGVNNVLDCHFTEDLYVMAVIGKIVFLDIDGIFKSGTLTGNEGVIISTNIDGLIKSWAFSVFDLRVLKASNSDTNYQTLCLYICNPEFIPMKTKIWPKGYKSTLISKIVQDMVNSVTGDNTQLPWKLKEDSNEKLDTFAPGQYCVVDHIKYLLPRMSSANTNVSGILLYPNSNCDTNFIWNLTSLETLLKQTNTLKLSSDDDGYYFTYSADYAEGHYNKMLDFQNTGASIEFDKELSGIMGSDFTATGKKDLTSQQLYTDMYNKVTKLGAGQIRNISSGPSKLLYTGEDDPKLIANIVFDRFVKTFNMQHIFKFKCKGHIKRYAGAMIEVTQANDTQQLSGKYLIKSITHVFKSSGSLPYLQIISCIKNAFFTGNTQATGNTNI